MASNIVGTRAKACIATCAYGLSTEVGTKEYFRGLVITYTILGVPYYNYSIMGPKNPFLISKAAMLRRSKEHVSRMR